MIIDRALLAADVAQAVASYPGEVRIDGHVLPASVSAFESTDSVDDTGVLNEADGEADVAWAALTGAGLSVPQNRSVIEARQQASDPWVKYHVEATNPASGVSVLIRLKRA